MKKMLTVGDHPLAPFGMAGQMQIYLKNWSKKCDINHISYDYTFPSFWWTGPNDDWNRIRMIGLPACATRESQFVGAFESLLGSGYKPDIVWTFGDIPWVGWMPEAKDKAPWISYFPVDSGDWHKNGLMLDYMIDMMDVPVTYSKWGQWHIKVDLGIDVDMIYHIIDRKQYYPFPPEKRKELRRKYLTRRGENSEDADDKFVVLTVARPQWRKNFDVMIRTMTDFLSSHKNAVWWIHADPRDPLAEFDFVRALQIAGIGRQVQITEGYYWNIGIPVEGMNVIYNLADCHFLLSGGEGFGLPMAEAMAAGVPNVTTNFTTGPEFCGLSGERGLLVEPAFNEYVMGGGSISHPRPHRSPVRLMNMVERPVASVPSAVWALEEIMGLTESNKKKMSENCIKYVTENFDEVKIMGQWDDLFKKYLGIYDIKEIVHVETPSKEKGIQI